MAIDITNYNFTWDGLSAQESLRVYVSEYGENYAERRGRGINPLQSEWSVNFFFVTLPELKSFLSLLRSSASEVFLWRSPISDTAAAYVINSWGVTPSSINLYQVNCTLKSWTGNT
jgi:phage-related protein